jgi:hypothetical protein
MECFLSLGQSTALFRTDVSSDSFFVVSLITTVATSKVLKSGCAKADAKQQAKGEGLSAGEQGRHALLK